MHTTLWSYLLRIRHFTINNCKPFNNKSPQKRNNNNARIETSLGKPSTLDKRFKVYQHISLKGNQLKQFAKDHWYIVLPLHGMLTLSYITFFYMGVRTHRKNIMKFLEDHGVHNTDSAKVDLKYLPKMSNAKLQEVVAILLLMKLSSPVRYASTFFAAKRLLRYLRRHHYIQLLPLVYFVKSE